MEGGSVKLAEKLNKKKIQGLKRARKWQRKIRLGAMKKLSTDGIPRCEICGFKEDIRLLQIDHINNDGNKERKKLTNSGKNNYHMYKQISNMNKKEASKKYRILCVFHNWADGLNIDASKYVLIKKDV